MRLAFASVMSKEGLESYQNFMEDMKEQDEIVTSEDLSAVGLEIRKG